uniref:Uncharacterized protein n=1 Tax=Anguilla anguilla TaxID=7936 RepID=A0A0E9Q863_ANGAN
MQYAYGQLRNMLLNNTSRLAFIV